MQGWTRNTAEATNEELRRVRKELARPGSAPLRIIIAGDPTKPVLSFTVSRRFLAKLAASAALCVGGLLLGAARGAPPASAISTASIYAGLAPQIINARGTADAPVPPHTRPATASPVQPPVEPEANEPPPQSAPRAAARENASAPSAASAVSSDKPDHFTIEMANTGKLLEVQLRSSTGEPDENSYRSLRHELRCQRTGAEYPIDPRLIEILHQIAIRTESRVQVVSAYRAPLRGDLNFHADIRVPGFGTAELRDLAKEVGARGIGYYPTVQFVHVDVRDLPFSWTDTSGHGEQPAEETPTGAELAAAAGSAPAAGEAKAPLLPFPLPTGSAQMAEPARPAQPPSSAATLLYGSVPVPQRAAADPAAPVERRTYQTDP